MLVSAGLLLYRIKESKPEVLLAHPGGPFYAKKDDGVWSLPKGQVDDGEDQEELLKVAEREFEEETGFAPHGPYTYLGTVDRQDGQKIVHAWAFEGDADPAQAKSNTFMMEWPPRSGRKIEVPEVDRVDFFDIETTKRKINPYQLGFIEAFEKLLGEKL